MEYYVKFSVHLDPVTKPRELPEVVFHEASFVVNDFQELRTKIDNQLTTFIIHRGVTVLRPSDKPLEDNSETLDLRIFIPMERIAFISQESKLITNNLEFDNDTVFRA